MSMTTAIAPSVDDQRDGIQHGVLKLPYSRDDSAWGAIMTPITVIKNGDGGNMNRAFPGHADGTVTEKIADYFQNHLLPMADVVLDIHAGGKTLEFLPFAVAHVLPDKAQ